MRVCMFHIYIAALLHSSPLVFCVYVSVCAYALLRCVRSSPLGIMFPAALGLPMYPTVLMYIFLKHDIFRSREQTKSQQLVHVSTHSHTRPMAQLYSTLGIHYAPEFDICPFQAEIT